MCISGCWKLKSSLAFPFHLTLSLFEDSLPSTLFNNTLLLVIFMYITCAILSYASTRTGGSSTVRNNQPPNSMNQFPQLTGEQPSDIARVTSEIEFLICSAPFLTVAWSWQGTLFTYCMLLYCKPVFHFQAHVLVSYLVLVSFVVGRCYKNEPGLNLELIQSLRGEQAVTFPSPCC